MKKLLMPDMLTRNKKYKIPGGWTAAVPDFAADPEYEAWLTGKLMPFHGHFRDRANAKAREYVDTMCMNAYLTNLKDFIAHNADEYAKRFPAMIQPDGTLSGYRPEVMARLYIPMLNRRRLGNTEARNALVEMASSTNKEAA